LTCLPVASRLRGRYRDTSIDTPMSPFKMFSLLSHRCFYSCDYDDSPHAPFIHFAKYPIICFLDPRDLYAMYSARATKIACLPIQSITIIIVSSEGVRVLREHRQRDARFAQDLSICSTRCCAANNSQVDCLRVRALGFPLMENALVFQRAEFWSSSHARLLHPGYCLFR